MVFSPAAEWMPSGFDFPARQLMTALINCPNEARKAKVTRMFINFWSMVGSLGPLE